MKKALFIVLVALLLSSSVVEAGRHTACQNMPQATFDSLTNVLHSPGLEYYPDQYTVDFLYQPELAGFSVTGLWPYMPPANFPGGFIGIDSSNNIEVEIHCLYNDYVNYWLQLNYNQTSPVFSLTNGGIAYDYANTDWQLYLQNGCSGEPFLNQSLYIDYNYIPSSLGSNGFLSTFQDQLYADFPDGTYFSGQVERGIWNGNYQKSGKKGCFTGTLKNTQLALNSGRFKVETSWTPPGGHPQSAYTLGTSDNAGMFWFFDSSNTEVVVKVLDACENNNRYWVFASAITNTEFNVTVTDTKTGSVKQYPNPAGSPFQHITDTDAFATCP